MTISAISNTSYSINSGVITFNFSAANWSSLACNYAVTYTATYKNAASNNIGKPEWLMFNGASRSFSINTTSQSDVGVYTITVIAYSPQPSESGFLSVSTSFDLDVQNDCIQTALVDKDINDMTVKVTLSSTQDIRSFI